MNCNKISDILQQLVLLIRLAQVSVDAELHSVIAMFVGCTGSDHDDRQVMRPRIAAQLLGQCEAIHVMALHYNSRSH